MKDGVLACSEHSVSLFGELVHSGEIRVALLGVQHHILGQIVLRLQRNDQEQ